jgi:anaerobic selenocysteine-containing dehydrogenase
MAHGLQSRFVMHLHEHDENSAPNQTKSAKPTDPEAHLAHGVPGVQPPLEPEGAVAGDRHKTAAGYFSIYETAHFGVKEMGVERTVQTLLKINQKDGFDCPSCAWPDPDGERKTAEFCENGANAVASEATTRRLTPEVFAGHRISEMLEKPDVWLEEQGRITHPMIRRSGSDYYEPISWDGAFELIDSELKAPGSPDAASSTRRVEPVMKPPSCMASSRGSSARTICRTVRTCVTSRAVRA